MSNAEQPGLDIAERTQEKAKTPEREKLGTGWKVLGVIDAIGLAVVREYFGQGQKKGEAAEKRSIPEFLTDIVKTSVDHLERAGKVMDTVDDLTANDQRRELERQIQDAPDDATRTELQTQLEAFNKQVQRDNEDRSSDQQGMRQMWDALTGPRETKPATE